MSGTTAIEWATDTWNPTKGCDRVSPGCDHCYALTMAKRLKGMGSPEYQRDGDPRTSGPGFLAHESPNDLDWPLRKTKPRLIFVNSMSDLFHDSISDEFIAEVWSVMAHADHHTFQILTKRHARMRALLSSDLFHQLWTPNWRTIAAIRTCAERGDNLEELAATCTRGLAHRTRDDVRKLLTFRLLRAAGLDTDDEGA